jgi:hypothetical protein
MGDIHSCFLLILLQGGLSGDSPPVVVHVLTLPCDCIVLQGLLADWQYLSQQVSSLSDQAAQRFDDQLQATQNMAALLASTMATIAGATTLAKRLQEKYVQQTLLMQAGGDNAVWVCNRTSKLVAGFSIARCAAAVAQVETVVCKQSSAPKTKDDCMQSAVLIVRSCVCGSGTCTVSMTQPPVVPTHAGWPSTPAHLQTTAVLVPAPQPASAAVCSQA